MKYFWIVLFLSTISCTQKKTEKIPDITDDPNDIIPTESDNGIGDGATSIIDFHIQNIEKAHKKNDYLKHKAISFDIDLTFGGKQRLDARITMLTNSSKIRIDKKDDTKLIFDGDKAYICPMDADSQKARFDMFTWSYFFGLPYKLSDPGTQWELKDEQTLHSTRYQTARLTFNKDTGDSPKDWYLVYTDPGTHLIQAAAYIVTYGSKDDISKAESDPHIIAFKDVKNIDGIPMPTTWIFSSWTSESGIKEELGKATITNITFLETVETIFDTPENAKEITL